MSDPEAWAAPTPAELREQAERRREALRVLSLPAEALADLKGIAEDPIAKRVRETGIAAVKHDPTHIYRAPDGRLQAGVERIVSDDEFEKIRQGYQCLHCWEEFHVNGLPAAFPETCPVCGFEVSAKQIEELELQHRGETFMGEDESPADTDARWSWLKAENRWRRAGGHGIVVPRSLE
jgi:DNA-directed RNA polymerase subunit RPC12/RpoP